MVMLVILVKVAYFGVNITLSFKVVFFCGCFLQGHDHTLITNLNDSTDWPPLKCSRIIKYTQKLVGHTPISKYILETLNFKQLTICSHCT